MKISKKYQVSKGKVIMMMLTRNFIILEFLFLRMQNIRYMFLFKN